MSKALHVTFFGASVTEQSIHHATGEVTGYVTYYEQHFAQEKNIKVSRVSAGSCNLTDAAIIYVNKVIALKPDICVIDWATTAISDCDIRFVNQVYNLLVANRIVTLTVILPRTDRVQSETLIADKMRRVSDRFGMPFHDVSTLISGDALSTALRDIVHTSPEGAKMYAHFMNEFITAVDLDNHTFTIEAPPFFVNEIATATALPLSAKQITVSASPDIREDVEYSVMLEQRVGPYSPVLQILSGEGSESVLMQRFSLWDPWCYRERQCLKPLMDWASGKLSKVILRVCSDDPPYSNAKEPTYVEPSARHIKPRGSLYLVSTQPVNCSVEFR